MLFLNASFMIRLRGSNDPYGYLTTNGFTNQEALRILNKEMDQVQFDELARLMQLLDCTLNDLSDWMGNADSPLAKLKKPTPHELERLLRSYSPEEVLAITRGIVP